MGNNENKSPAHRKHKSKTKETAQIKVKKNHSKKVMEENYIQVNNFKSTPENALKTTHLTNPTPTLTHLAS